MDTNILAGIYNIVHDHDTPVWEVREEAPVYNIRINNAGDRLELFVKDAIANTIDATPYARQKIYGEIYSWLGSQNNPPDLIIKNGDAFEIKKVESISSTNIALNSSHPKNKLYANDEKITKACRECEDEPWTEKDLFYCVGVMQKNIVRHLLFIHGLCYVADPEVYEKLHSSIKEKTEEGIAVSGYVGTDTKEIGRINRVDPMGITNLRIRGMWEIKNPFSVFEIFLSLSKESTFTLHAILTTEKYNSYPKKSRDLIEKESKVQIQDIELVDPNNLAKTLQAKLISVCW